MDECICFVTPEHMWFRYGSAVEPASQMEPNPECPVHFPVGRHSEEAAEHRGTWLRWHNGSDVGSTPGFRRGGKAAG